jgi:hypothetical protein
MKNHCVTTFRASQPWLPLGGREALAEMLRICRFILLQPFDVWRHSLGVTEVKMVSEEIHYI